MAQDWFSIFRSIAVIFANLMFVKYFVFLILAPIYQIIETLRKSRAILKQEYKNYKVSVIIPAWNESVGIVKTVKSVLENDYDNVEILAVNDGSTDNTEKVMNSFVKKIRRLRKSHKWRRKQLRFISYTVNGGKGHALNTGVKKATGDIILTIDADSKLDKHAIKNLVVYYQDLKVDGVVGNVIVANSQTILGLTQRLEYLFGFYFKRSHAVMGAEYIFGGACASFRKAVFDHIGYYDEKNKTEDIEMTMRFRFYGYNCTYGEDVICYTEGASDIMGLLKQRLRWKKGRMDTFVKYRSMFFSKDKRHNKALTFFVLPYALLAEFQLFLEPISIALLITYSFIALDFLSIAFGILFIFVLYFINGLFNGKKINLGLLILFPLTWPLFYFLIWVEYLALLTSIGMVLRGEEIVWQQWQRKGI
ncbi:MAG: Glycosyl transferase family 2 [candidate division WS6 bacterium GW2011_GWF2_39_15]|uniref:Glycosyl transferase family 2 n=1 Tax=candidate division WS6 bacterium GW2011_GWF2_39_15 TaxID=1619100 RepID=A0A0G0MYV7_9BACT|nr:MAG: Glycosyl transferase family 2 [candidate division WS6 bacterium GW2011_GWF2_39_15]